MMNKIFEIPIYAFSRKKLEKCFINKRSKIIKEYHIQNAEIDMIDSIVDPITYPFRIWDYNHIIGYITISLKERNLYFDVYLPYKRKKFPWRTNNKVYLRNTMANGTHIFIGKNDSNKTIQKKVADELDNVIQGHVHKNRYVDRETFDNINQLIAYKKLLLNVENKI